MQGVSHAAQPWLGLFCPANACLPSWRHPGDPWLVSRDEPSLAEQRQRMVAVARSGVLSGMRDCLARKDGAYGVKEAGNGAT
jgi:hypothetical protein